MRIKDHEFDLLITLEKVMEKCKKCHNNIWSPEDIRNIPLEWTPLSKYIIVADYMGYIKPSFWTEINGKGLRSELFAIIYMVNCNISYDDSLGRCNEYVRKFIKLIDPERIIMMGPVTHKNYINDPYPDNGESFMITLDDDHKYTALTYKNEWGIKNFIDSLVEQ